MHVLSILDWCMQKRNIIGKVVLGTHSEDQNRSFFGQDMENTKSESIDSVKGDSLEQRGVPVHSQVRKIKQESEKILEWSPGHPEIRPVFREISRQIPRSPLGISGRPISVGHS